MLSTVLPSSPVCRDMAVRALARLATSRAVPVPARLLCPAWNRVLPSAMFGLDGEDAPHHVGFKGGRGRAEERRHPGEGIEIVIDQHLAGDADDLAIGLDAVGLLGFPDGAALELARFIHLLELRGFAQLQALDRLEVGNGRAPARSPGRSGVLPHRPPGASGW